MCERRLVRSLFGACAWPAQIKHVKKKKRLHAYGVKRSRGVRIVLQALCENGLVGNGLVVVPKCCKRSEWGLYEEGVLF